MQTLTHPSTALTVQDLDAPSYLQMENERRAQQAAEREAQAAANAREKAEKQARYQEWLRRQRHNPYSVSTRKMRQSAADLIVHGMSAREICYKLGISRVTLWRWKQREDFQKLVKAMKLELTEPAYFYLQKSRLELMERMVQLALGDNVAISYKATAFLLKHA